MNWQQRDPFRWRRRLALIPRKIATQWIWLEWYAWRPLRRDEFAPIRPQHVWLTIVHEFTVRTTGFTAWRERQYVSLGGRPITRWRRPVTRLDVVKR